MRAAAAATAAGNTGGGLGRKRYTFSVVDDEPLSPKTPALPGKVQVANPFDQGAYGAPDPVVSVPTMIDNSVITIQNRMEVVGQAVRKDQDALDENDHRMEFELMNSVYKTVQNIAYHINKLVRLLNPREDTLARPVEGQDALDMISGLRNAMTKCQQGGTTLGKLVKDRKRMLGVETTVEVIGDSGVDMLNRIEGAMVYALVKSGKLVDAIQAGQKRRQRALLQVGAAAFIQVQAQQGDVKAALDLTFRAWVEAVAALKEERELEATMKEGDEDQALHEGQDIQE